MVIRFLDRQLPAGLPPSDVRRGRFLMAVLAFTVVTSVLSFVLSILLQGTGFHPVNASGFLGVLALAAITRWAVRRFGIQTAAAGFVGLGFLLVNGISVFTGGLSSPSYLSNVVLLVIAGAISPPRQVAGLFLGAMLAGTGFLFFEPMLPDWTPKPIDWYLTEAFLFGLSALVVVALSTLHDVAENDASIREDELLAARERLVATTVSTNYIRGVLAAARDLLLVTDESFVIVDANPAVTEVLGFTREELIGRSMNDLGDLTESLGAADRKAVPGKLTRVDGRTLPVSVSRGRLGGVAAGSSGYSGFVFAVTDTTLQQAAVEAVRRAHGEAEAANQAKSRFLANMSHELRTPLNAIIGYSELLAEDVLSTEAAGDLERVQSAAHHLLQLINGILDLSKVEAGRMQLVVSDVDVDTLVIAVVDAVRPSLRGGVELITLLEPLGTARLDDMRTRQILLNLLSNAVKFTRKGEVRVEARRWDREGMPWLRVVVADSGPGIERERLAEIFEPFSQADASTEREFGGTGLGLSISQAFARMMGGAIHVQSTLGEGARFTLELPIGDLQWLRTPGAAPSSEIPRRQAGRHLVLCIDDDPAVLELLGRMLGGSDRQVVGTPDAEQGLRWARTLQPDLITLDIQMPGMSGWNILAHLREDPVLRGIPTLVITGEGEENVALALGARALVHKPVERTTLIALVESLLP